MVMIHTDIHKHTHKHTYGNHSQRQNKTDIQFLDHLLCYSRRHSEMTEPLTPSHINTNTPLRLSKSESLFELNELINYNVLTSYWA